MAANLNVQWIHGSPNCAANADPPLQVHRYDENTFILRQNKCLNFEGPFMYLLFGTNRALLLDTGAESDGRPFPLADTVRGLINRWLAEAPGRQALPLLICHSHAHGDHAVGDAQFRGHPGVTIVPPTLAGVRQFFGFTQWPTQTATLELGNRTLDVFAVPGHEAAHIALYDRVGKLLLSGDTLYPGLLVVRDWQAYRQSIARLQRFAETHEIKYILGAHIEMTSQPGRWFGYPATYQPGEHVLQLEARHLRELHETLSPLPVPRTVRRADFILHPANAPAPPLVG